MLQQITIGMFGSFVISKNEQRINLEDLLGKQIASLLAYFAYEHDKTLTKERLCAIFWPDSDNPENALKNAIFRLRAELKKEPVLADTEWIVTTKGGYTFCNAEHVAYEPDEFRQCVNQLKQAQTETEPLYEALFALYTRPFLENITADWATPLRVKYYDEYVRHMGQWMEQLIERKQYNRIFAVCEKVLSMDPYHEDFHYYYLKALIETRRYNEAIQYYERISRLFYEELGIPLLQKTQSLLNIISSKNDSYRTSLDELMDKVVDDDSAQGAYYCDYAVFKGLCQLERRNCLRERQNKYLILLESKYSGTEYAQVYTSRLLEIVRRSLRKNDVVSQVSQSQIVMLLTVKNEKDVYLVIDRIINEFYKRVVRDKVRINYYVSGILKDPQPIQVNNN